MIGRRTAVLAAATMLTLAGGVSVAAAAPVPVAFHSAGGLTVQAARQVDARLWKLTVSTPALSRPVRVDVLLPTGYASTTTRYPTLYLFHGTSGGADDWVRQGNAEAATASYPMIVVMPDGGYDGNGGGFFTNWVDQHTSLGAADWETFDVDQLIPFVDQNLRTVTARTGRAVAGLSQGGFGSFSYAARHPDTFVSAASFSGAPDIASNPVTKLGGTLVVGAIAGALDGVSPDAIFGNSLLDDINWRGHDPADLVTNLGPVDLRLWTGNGVPGPLDDPTNLPTFVGGIPIEVVTHASTLSFVDAATRAGIRTTLDDYGNGTHSFPYWARDLTQYLPALAATFAHPPAAPRTISYRSVDRTWTQWGWTVVTHRAAEQAWSSLTSASPAGFVYTGDAADVRTPAAYTPGRAYRVDVAGSATTVRADNTGRLTVTVSGTSTVAVSGT